MGKQLFYGYKFADKEFAGTTTKQAFLNACKWYATYVIAPDRIHGISVEFIKHKTEPKVTIVLYATLDQVEAMEDHCKICREVHTLFYSNTGYNCDRCEVKAYIKRLEQKAAIKSGYCDEMLHYANKQGG